MIQKDFFFFVMGLYSWVSKFFCKDNDYFIPANSIGGFSRFDLISVKS